MNNTDVQIEMSKTRQEKGGKEGQVERRRYTMGKISALIITGLIGYFFYLLYWPFAVTYLDDIIISTDPITAGQYQRYTAKDCQNDGIEGEVVRNIVLRNTDEAPISSTRVPVRPIECSNIILIPENLPNGTYEVTLHIIFHVNPIRDALNPITRDYRSAPFDVNGGKDIRIPRNLPSRTEPDNLNDSVRTSPAPVDEVVRSNTQKQTESQPQTSVATPQVPKPAPAPTLPTPEVVQPAPKPVPAPAITRTRPLLDVELDVAGTAKEVVGETRNLTCSLLLLLCR